VAYVLLKLDANSLNDFFLFLFFYQFTSRSVYNLIKLPKETPTGFVNRFNRFIEKIRITTAIRSRFGQRFKAPLRLVMEQN